MRKNFSQGAIIQAIKIMKSSDMDCPRVIEEYKSIVEGRAVLRITSEKVFYNPVQEFNRDLSIVALSVFVRDFKKQKLMEAQEKNCNESENELGGEKKIEIKILEALSATGLRSIRYAKEIVDITKVIANDISDKAVNTIKDNIAFNSVDHIVETSHEDACLLMYKHKSRSKNFAAVDLDPYGAPTIFLDSAVQSVAHGGLLLVTATDMAVLAGNSPQTCYSKYGAISLRTKCCHEMALRILLQCIESHANKYNRYIVPMLSVSADFYIRVFVKVYVGAKECKFTTSKLSMVYRCVGCDSITLQPLGGVTPQPLPNNPSHVKLFLPSAPPVGEFCDNCNQKHQMGGPIWSGALHDKSFVARALSLVQKSSEQFATARRLEGVLSVIGEELDDAPLYCALDRLCATVHCEMMPMLLFRSALLNAGYEVSYSHANRLSVKTDAPKRFVWDIIRTWVKEQPVKAAKLEANPVAKHILAQPVKNEVDLTARDDANPDSRRDRQTRFQFNPAPYWGPGCRSTINTEENMNLKSKRNQNKRKSKWNDHNKRPLSPSAGEEAGKKKTSQQRLIIDTTTSEAGSDSGTDPTRVGAIGTDPGVGISQGDVDMSSAEQKVDNGSTPDAHAITSEIPTDPKQ